MKKFKKVLKWIFTTFAFLILAGAAFFSLFYFFVTNSVSLDESKLSKSAGTLISVTCQSGEALAPTSESLCKISEINLYTKNAFTSAEDKRFYKHSGVDFVRLAGAAVQNVKSHSFSQGASTISQQLIKNTHLSSEKTIKRKLKEIKLTRQLEKKYSKDEILEMYLNSIYFGSGCYGIENAAWHYFSKSAKDLTLSESATLAATINAPAIYDVEQPNGKIKTRRDLILSLMSKYGKITSDECQKAQNEPIELKLSNLTGSNIIYDKILNEACSILGVSQNEIKGKNITIETNVDDKLQDNIANIIKQNYSKLESNPEIAVIVIDNHTHTISAMVGSKSAIEGKRQPGSLAKPILVYAPAIEYNMISPCTKILDEKINIGGYSPDNADKSYHGYVSARTALAKSYNIPAVKLLKELGTKRSMEFAEKLQVNLTENDNNLGIALGGFYEGVNIKTLADAYSAFASSGKFESSKFITKIKDENGKVLYRRKTNESQVMKDSTAYLVTDMLMSAVSSGTAKRLSGANFNVAAKTGTVGLSNSRKNTDAYSVCYTSEHTVLTYIGSKIMPEYINGATYPSSINKNTLDLLYKNHTPENFKIPYSITKKLISKSDYDNNILALSNNEDGILEVFSKDNLPQKSVTSISKNLTAINTENSKPILIFDIVPALSYKLFREDENGKVLLETFKENETSKTIKFEDISAQSGKIYDYFIEICDFSSNKTIQSNRIKLKCY